ncbi:hypothetical protein ABC970_22425 [Bacillus licheniformis]|uniref:hypothetical protein n=1 Tax=Bacillus TaxID=1386 RepID=UPI00047064EC|nr:MULTISPECIES: hypothetical protein [Bacillus]ASK26288.1 hypothetical protein BSSX_p0097 [Bacillus subtilis]MCA1184537.1 hypothetical protein [Bacillus licheniformis]MCQ5304514.1 hypothetical protein [Bacillus licheniformis]MDM5287329.1 hypothetical protein [Bacillus licheniformis]MDN5389931.1 hypothetical protein [Bacillus sp. LB7]
MNELKMNKELLLSDIENDLNKMNDRQLKDLGYEFLHTGIISIRALTAEMFEKKVLNKANEVCNVISSAIHNLPFLLFADYNRDMLIWELSQCITKMKRLEHELKDNIRILINPFIEVMKKRESL